MADLTLEVFMLIVSSLKEVRACFFEEMDSLWIFCPTSLLGPRKKAL